MSTIPWIKCHNSSSSENSYVFPGLSRFAVTLHSSLVVFRFVHIDRPWWTWQTFPLIFFGFLVQTHQGQEAWWTVGSPVKAQITKPESLGLKVWADVSTSDLLSTFWSELLKSNVTYPPWFPSLWVSTFFCWPPPCEVQISDSIDTISAC